MSDKDDGNNGRNYSSPYIRRDECGNMRREVLQNLEDIKLILRGSSGRNGLVKDVNYLLNKSHIQDRVMAVFIGVLSTIITALIITRLGGI